MNPDNASIETDSGGANAASTVSRVATSFYQSIPVISGTNAGCEADIRNSLASLEASSRMMDASIYVVDFYRRSFRFVSGHPLFLCGHSPAEVQQLGYGFYPRIVHGDLLLITGIHQVIYHYLHRPGARLSDLDYIAFNFRICHNSEYQMVCHKVVPLMVDGRPQLTVCMVTESVRKKPGNLCAYYKEEASCEQYLFREKTWESLPAIKLTPQEKAIMRLAIQGRSKDAPEIMCMTVQSAQNLKSRLFRKLDVHTMEQAVIFVRNNHISLD